ncbi:Uncharacterized protein FWK35_00030561, partial [Aphis craccivora]
MIITSRNNAPISNYGGGFRCKIFKKIEKNKKKITEKREFLRKTSFRQNRLFLWFVDNKFMDDQKFKLLRNLSKTRKFAKLKLQH